MADNPAIATCVKSEPDVNPETILEPAKTECDQTDVKTEVDFLEASESEHDLPRLKRSQSSIQ